MYRLLLSLAVLALPMAAFAGDVTIENAWSRAAIEGHSGAVYMTVTNTGGTADKIMGVSTPVAQMAHVHESLSDGGVMKMRPAPALPVMPGKPVTLAPGGYHVMLMGLKQPLTKGEHFPLTLTFEHAEPVTVQVEVEAAGAAHPAGQHMDMQMPMK